MNITNSNGLKSIRVGKMLKKSFDRNTLIKLLLVILFGSNINCLQSRDELSPVAAGLLLGELDLGAPGTIGLDLRLNNRNWSRGCETRMGNLGADAYAWKARADIGVINGGAIRDTPLDLIPKGTKPTEDLFKTFIIFANTLSRVRVRFYRIKQAMESSVNAISQPAIAGDRATANSDSDGPQTGNCFSIDSSGSGRFLHISNRLSIDVNPFNTRQTTTGTQSNSDISIVTPGRRITKILYDGILIYNSPTGEINSNVSGISGQLGWGVKSGSNCVVNGVAFTNSLACEFITVGITNFQQSGGDSIPSFSPIFPGNGDGSIFLEATDLGDDATSIVDYVETVYTRSPVFPRIGGRIIMP